MEGKKKPDADYVIKALIVGEKAVGKTNILTRYCDNVFKPVHSSNIGLDFKIKVVQVEQFKIKIQFWDLAGEQQLKYKLNTIYKGALVILLTYSIDQRKSFEGVQNWLNHQKQNISHESLIFLVGNKSDLGESRCVAFEEGKKLADDHGSHFYEVSAKQGTNIQELFQKIALQAYKTIKKLGSS